MFLANKLGAFGVMLSDAADKVADDLSSSAAALLLTLHYRPGTTATGLAEVAGIAQPTAARILDGLIGRGLIERQPRTGRTAPLRLTRAGKRRAQSLQSARLGALERFLGMLSGEERESFERALDRILATATTSRAFARTTCRLCDHAACVGPLCPIGTRASAPERGVGIMPGGETC